MNTKCCVDGSHKYGLWYIDEDKKLAWRSCYKCKFRRELPICDEINEEIRKQEEASDLFKAFKLVENHDDNIINYLNLIIEDYISYLDSNDLIAFTSRIKELEQLDIINIQDAFYSTHLNGFLEIPNDKVTDYYIESDIFSVSADYLE